ncbi:TonB-linked outer membrane protein, SusC/RagA family [Parapedobacter composti]|uniref:TonB-linked outer membrane protein, SusC/RagA family n=1 Tax=Parapedobacter composti TaxID=623281 RepID=A0A1I1F7Q4_9SPHI|nr:TonB-dependent receptor [Parapedobacter composti]SFB93738.1 TonB-linked outer membrane protein, SusC/RagA family [Parapedobacter composti]
MAKQIYYLMMFCLLTSATVLAQQTARVTGYVTDNGGRPLQGVTVTRGGSGPGAVTAADGAFSLDIARGDELSFTLVGYQSQKIVYDGQPSVQVQLSPEERSLEEVVVVGYGTMKRRDLVGAVDQISGDRLQNRGNMNISRSLQGMMPGLNITMRDGKPSRGATLNLRGTGSIGAGGGALILIDGVEGDMTTVNPDDVESVSILKDASSAAVYGARGAFGVVLITTKKAAEGKPKITYSGGLSRHQRLVKMEDNIISNGLQWTDGWYKAYMEGMDLGTPPGGINNVFKYSTEWYNELRKRDADPTLEKIRVNSAGEYEYFGNTNWFDVVYRDYNLSTEHNLSLSGGTDRAKYYLSGRYFNQEGIYNAGNEDYNQYNVRAKGQIQLTPKLVLDNNMDFIRRHIHQPMVMYDRQLLPRMLEHQAYPMTMVRNLDGTWTETAVYTGWAGFVEGTSYQKNQKFDLRNITGLTYTAIPEQLIFKGEFTYLFNHSERQRVENMYDFYTGPSIKKTRHTFSSLEHYSYDNQYMVLNATANYIPKFSGTDHRLNLLAGWNMEERRSRDIRTYRRGLLYPTKPSFALMDGDYYINDQAGYEWAYAGLFFRGNYNYKDKYLVEVSGRYDGTSKFPSNQQWGFFPSASLAWRINEERFMQPTAGWLNDLKLRLSVGGLGNGNVDPYLYLPTMPINRSSLIIDDLLQTYTYAPANIPRSLTWEKATTYDIGLDFTVLNNRLSVILDYYERHTTDMFTVGPEVPHVFGAAIPRGNNADLKTKGWEASVEWRDQGSLADKPFQYSVKAMLWDSRSWVTKYNNPNKLLSTYYEGMEIGEIWGYRILGLFRDQEDIDNHVDQSRIIVSGSNILKPGDLKFADLNGDQAITPGANTVDDPGDRTIIGNTTPRYQFGVNLGFSWNRIGLNAFIQGVGQRHWYPAKESAYFWGQYNRPYGYMLNMHTGDNVWTEENQNVDAYWPRYRGYLALNANRSMTVTNDRYLQNAAYVRLKNLQISYAFSPRICSKLGMQALNVYLAGENLYTWSPMFRVTKNFDPEVIHAGDTDFRATSGTDGDGYGYPMLNTYTLGINLTF